MLWIQFAVCAGLVVLVGGLLSRYADILAEKTGLGRGWVGAVLLAGATTLPELTTGISAVVVLDEVNLAAGGVLGSCLFNLLLLALLDAVAGRTPLLRRAQTSHILAAGLGVMLLSIVMLGEYATQMVGLPSLGWIGLPTIAMIVVYVVSVRLISYFERRRVAEVLEQEAEIFQYESIPLRRALVVFGLLAIAIVILGFWLAALADQIAETTGLGATFVGAIFLSVTTSLPEIVAGFTAVRIGAVDLAVSNIFGANLINCTALAIYDLVYARGDLWAVLDPIHGFTAISAALMTSLAIVSLMYRTARRPVRFVGWDALGLLLIYIGTIYMLYQAAV
jgi:cation:H+ antiporter